MAREPTAPHRPHSLLVTIESVDGLFEARIEEPGVIGPPHFSMAGPPRPYDEVVDEVVEALRRHLMSPGE